MKAENSTKIQFDSLSVNEAFARGAAAAFLARYDPTVPQLADIKTAVSEAVTNCIVHAYPDRVGPVVLTLAVYPGRLVRITVADKGIGIPDIPKAMEPLFTTGNPEERSGLGFAVMQSFMDKVTVHSVPGRGTRVTLTKRLDEHPLHKKRKRERLWYPTRPDAARSLNRIWGWCIPAPGGSGGEDWNTMTSTVPGVWG